MMDSIDAREVMEWFARRAGYSGCMLLRGTSNAGIAFTKDGACPGVLKMKDGDYESWLGWSTNVVFKKPRWNAKAKTWWKCALDAIFGAASNGKHVFVTEGGYPSDGPMHDVIVLSPRTSIEEVLVSLDLA